MYDKRPKWKAGSRNNLPEWLLCDTSQNVMFYIYWRERERLSADPALTTASFVAELNNCKMKDVKGHEASNDHVWYKICSEKFAEENGGHTC